MARGLLVATAAVAACVLSGCGQTSAPSAGGGTSSSGAARPAACVRPKLQMPGRTVMLTNSANGKTFCVQRGTRIYVFLHGTQARRWAPIRPSSAALVPIPSGVFTLMIGETGGFFKAAKPGIATLASTRSPCLQKHALCSRPATFRLTIKISG
jgi:hypothetical protein